MRQSTGPAQSVGDAIEDEPRRSFVPRRPPEHLRRLAADDEQDAFLGRGLAHAALADDAAVAQDHHAVGDLEHLVEPVRDVDHPDAAGAQPPQRCEGRVARGVGMIYVSHRLDEVFEIADRMVILRDGRVGANAA